MELVEVGSFLTRESAEVCRGLLEASNIKAVVMTDDVGGLRPHMAFASSSAVRLMVESDQQEDARAILAYESEEDFAEYWDKHHRDSVEGEPNQKPKSTVSDIPEVRRAFWSAILGMTFAPLIGQAFSMYQLFHIYPKLGELSKSDQKTTIIALVINILSLYFFFKIYRS